MRNERFLHDLRRLAKAGAKSCFSEGRAESKRSGRHHYIRRTLFWRKQSEKACIAMELRSIHVILTNGNTGPPPHRDLMLKNALNDQSTGARYRP